jgi:hypothetical protein
MIAVFLFEKKDIKKRPEGRYLDFLELVLMQLVQILVFLPSIFLDCKLIFSVRLVLTLE